MDALRSILASVVRGAGNLTCPPSDYINGFVRKVEYLYAERPWKKVPGPWLLKIEIDNKTRYALILGTTDKEQRGIQFFDSMEEYEKMCSLGSSKTLTGGLSFFCVSFDEGKKSRATLGKFVNMSPTTITWAEVLFCEAAIQAVTDFVNEGARMQAELVAAGTAANPLMMFNRLTSATEHPCCQRIPTVSRGDVEVIVTLVPTQTSLQQLFQGQHSNKPPREVSTLLFPSFLFRF